MTLLRQVLKKTLGLANNMELDKIKRGGIDHLVGTYPHSAQNLLYIMFIQYILFQLQPTTNEMT